MNQQYMTAGLLSLGVISIILFISLLIVLKKRGRVGNWDAQFKTLSLQLEKMEDMASQVEDLSRIFTLPQMRGAAGELMLEGLLSNWLPAGAYSMQYKFQSGARADAVIRLGRFIVPIDSKFPLESISTILDKENGVGKQVQRVFLKHVEDIATKYIRPEEGTMQFALMYIPSEKIYYRTFIEDDGSFMREILKRGVLPVSPSNIFTYLQTVAYGLKGFSFSKNQKKILDQIHRLREDFTLMNKQYELGTTHLKNLQKVWDETNLRLNRMDNSIEKMENPEEASKIP